MSEEAAIQIGSIGWVDLTVQDADKTVQFYKDVVGWDIEKMDMGGYNDYILKIKGTNIPVAGICNAKGVNKDIPPVWLNYFTVKDINKSIEKCKASGGSIVLPTKLMGNYGKVCIIKDNNGVISALFEQL